MTSKDKGVFETPRVLAPATQAAALESNDVPARILKKRESDRRCQRIKRERTKSKIAALEERVRSLGTEDPTGRVQMLMQQLQNVERERDELAKKVKTIENVIREGETEGAGRERNDSAVVHQHAVSTHGSPGTAGSSDHEHSDPGSYFPHAENEADSFIARSTNEVRDSLLAHGVAAPYSELPIPETSASVDQAFHNPSSSNMSQPSQLGVATCECCAGQSVATDQSQFNTWRFTNQVLSSRFKWPAYFQMLQDTFRDDIPIRAVVEGWDSVEARGFMHPSWLILKQLDQNLFRDWQPKERLAVMYASQLLLMSHTSLEALPELPTFYRKRPSQHMADNYAIHFFPWPGMRERFVFNQHRYCTNDFWKTFLRSLRILWPFEFRDCYTRNIETGLFTVSPMFEERINNINCWAMESEVFRKWPELAVDIPQYNTIPPAVSNLVQKPRRLKAPPRLRSTLSTQQVNMTSTQPTVQPSQPMQVYMPPEAPVSRPEMYYSQSLVYTMGEKSIPIVSWAEDPLQEAQATIDYYAPVAPTNVTTSL